MCIYIYIYKEGNEQRVNNNIYWAKSVYAKQLKRFQNYLNKFKAFALIVKASGIYFIINEVANLFKSGGRIVYKKLKSKPNFDVGKLILWLFKF